MTGTFQGVGVFQYSPDNKFVAGYSGVKSTGAPALTEETLFEDSTNSQYLVLTIDVRRGTGGNVGNDYVHHIYINGIEVLEEYDSTVNDSPPSLYPVKIILPPFATLKVTTENITSGVDNNISAVIMGSVHGTIEQFDLELKSE